MVLLAMQLGLTGCAPSGPEQPWPDLAEASREAHGWCALSQAMVENIDPIVLEYIEVEAYADADAFIKSKPGIEDDRLLVTTYTDSLDDGTEQLWCKMKTNAAIERDLGLTVGTRRDCAEANRAALEVALGWHDSVAAGELPVALAEDLNTVTGSGWVSKSVELTDDGLRAVRLRTGLAVPFVPGMSYCKLLTLKSARDLVGREGSFEMSSLISRAFRAVGFWGGRMMQQQFERTSKDAVAANRKTLLEILSTNADTEFGRSHDFKAIAEDSTGASYRGRVPLSTYADYSDAIARMERGEEGVLTADEVLFFALSSGTTGTTKLVPTTKRHHGYSFKYMGTVVQGVISNELHPPGPTERGVDLLSFASEQQLSSGGVPIGSATAEAVRRMARIVPHLWNSPIEIYTLPHQPSARYIHALYGLRNRQNQFVEAVFAPRLLEWLREVVARWDELDR